MAVDLTTAIAKLDGPQAAIVLASALEMQGVEFDLPKMAATQAHLEEALSQGEIVEFVHSSRHEAPEGLAILALGRLAALGGESERSVEQALSSFDQQVARDSSAAFGLGTLVLYVFSSELKLERSKDKGWHFVFHHKPLSENLIGQLLVKLYSTILKR